MLARFLAVSIHRQLVALAVGPVVLLVLLGTISESLMVQDSESISQARTVAMRIEMARDMMLSAATTEERREVLNAVTRSGLAIHEVPVAEALGGVQPVVTDNFMSEILKNLPPDLKAKLGGTIDSQSLKNVLLVTLDDKNALAIVPPPPVSDSWITDRQVSGFLKTLAVFVPVILLSLFGSRMIASPLLQFAREAQKLDPGNGPEHPFEEKGALEVRLLARSLNDMRSRVRAMIDARTRMLRAISHDLRTPLTRLRLRAERSTQPELRSALLADIDSLTMMMEETLTYLRRDKSRDELLKVDLPSLLVTACNDFADMGHSVSYRGPKRFTYRCRPHQLKRAIANLIENATKFAENVIVELAFAEDGAPIIRVSDDGPGIPPEHRSAVLEPFFKLDAARSDRGGFGLGLSIVHDTVQAHLGDMRLAQALPHGLLVEINLPAQGNTKISPQEVKRDVQSKKTVGDDKNGLTKTRS